MIAYCDREPRNRVVYPLQVGGDISHAQFDKSNGLQINLLARRRTDRQSFEYDYPLFPTPTQVFGHRSSPAPKHRQGNRDARGACVQHATRQSASAKKLERKPSSAQRQSSPTFFVPSGLLTELSSRQCQVGMASRRPVGGRSAMVFGTAMYRRREMVEMESRNADPRSGT